MGNQVCLITGVGPGTGAALARRFATGGFRVAMLARDQRRLQELEQEIDGSKGFPCDVTDAAALEATCAAVRSQLRAPQVVIYNAVGGRSGTFRPSIRACYVRTSRSTRWRS